MVAGLLLCDRTLFIWSSPWKTPEWIEKKQTFLQKSQNSSFPSILLVGDSTINTGIYPEFSPATNAFNFGRSALNPSELPCLNQEILNTRIQPRSILFSITPYNMVNAPWENRYATPFPLKAMALAKGFFLDPALGDSIFFTGKAYARPLVLEFFKKFSKSIRGIRKPSRSFKIALDGSSRPTNPTPSDPEVHFWFDFPRGTATEIPPLYLKSIKDFKFYWESRGVPVYWIRMPRHPRYQELLFQQQPRLAHGYEQSIEDIFGNQIIDASKNISQKDYLDGVHLRPSGAIELSSRLPFPTQGVP